MATTAITPGPNGVGNPGPNATSDQDAGTGPEETLSEQFKDWMRTELVWYAGSFSFHLLVLSLLLLLPGFGGGHDESGVPTFASIDDQQKEEKKLDDTVKTELDPVADIDFEPPALKIDTVLKPPTQIADEPTAQSVDKPVGGGRKDGKKDDFAGKIVNGNGPGPTSSREAGIFSNNHPELGDGIHDGRGDTIGFVRGNLKGQIGGGGRTIITERTVNAALIWLAKHQDYDGSWSLTGFTHQCKPGDKTCTGTSEILADSGATAMGLLPFLAAGQTHRAICPYKETVRKGIAWLVRHQQPDGNLALGAQQMMYSHGLATIALAEAYGMTGDREVGRAAQAAVNFILNAQNADGGWRYNLKDPGDTSVVGWQLMALKSAHMAGLDVGGSVFSNTSKWLDSVAVHDGAEYAYQPGQGPAPAMTSVGLLCRQYLGAKRDNPMLTGGMSYLLNHMPDEDFPNIYYWYYATQVMHNMYGSEWDTWNRKMRNILVKTQVRNLEECANGSWPPEKDAWGRRGGRLMQTSLSCLTLEVYYRYLPLFKSETGGAAATARGLK